MERCNARKTNYKTTVNQYFNSLFGGINNHAKQGFDYVQNSRTAKYVTKHVKGLAVAAEDCCRIPEYLLREKLEIPDEISTKQLLKNAPRIAYYVAQDVGRTATDKNFWSQNKVPIEIGAVTLALTVLTEQIGARIPGIGWSSAVDPRIPDLEHTKTYTGTLHLPWYQIGERIIKSVTDENKIQDFANNSANLNLIPHALEGLVLGAVTGAVTKLAQNKRQRKND